MTPKVLYQYKQLAGDKWRPSNGTEGEIFFEAFCSQCWYDAKFRRTQNGKDGCEVWLGALLYYPQDNEYPDELVFDDDGWPTCTKYRKGG